MSKWDEYQNFSTAAGKAGGVQKLIMIIENKAVSKAAPGIFAKGAGAGAALAVVMGAAGKKFMDKRKTDQAVADEAKNQLIAEVEVLETEADDDVSEDGREPESGVDPV